MPSVNLTLALIDKLPASPAGKRVSYFDSTQHYLVLRVTDKGTKTFYFTYRDARGRFVWHRLPIWSGKNLGDVRKAATALQVAVDKGGDPAQERSEQRRAAREAVTMQELWEDFIAAKRSTARPGTLESYQTLWRLRVEPAFASRPASSITVQEVRRWHRGLMEGGLSGRSANMTVDVMRMVFNHGAAENLLPDGMANPAAGVKKFKETKRQRYLDGEGVGLLLAALDAEEAAGGLAAVPRVGEALPGRGGRGLREESPRGIEPQVAGLFRLLLLTGCRLSEVRLARWEWIDWTAAAMDLPEEASKTGARRVLLNAPAVTELARLRALAEPLGTPWVIWSPRDARDHLSAPHRAWYRVLRRAAQIDAEERAAAGLPPRPSPLEGLRPHDLRHSAASIAVSRGKSLPIIAGMLGHRSSATASRYAHLHDDPLRAAVEDVGAAVAEAVAARGKVLEVADLRAETKDVDKPGTKGRATW